MERLNAVFGWDNVREGEADCRSNGKDDEYDCRAQLVLEELLGAGSEFERDGEAGVSKTMP